VVASAPPPKMAPPKPATATLSPVAQPPEPPPPAPRPEAAPTLAKPTEPPAIDYYDPNWERVQDAGPETSRSGAKPVTDGEVVGKQCNRRNGELRAFHRFSPAAKERYRLWDDFLDALRKRFPGREPRDPQQVLKDEIGKAIKLTLELKVAIEAKETARRIA